MLGSRSRLIFRSSSGFLRGRGRDREDSCCLVIYSLCYSLTISDSKGLVTMHTYPLDSTMPTLPLCHVYLLYMQFCFFRNPPLLYGLLGQGRRLAITPGVAKPDQRVTDNFARDFAKISKFETQSRNSFQISSSHST